MQNESILLLSTDLIFAGSFKTAGLGTLKANSLQCKFYIRTSVFKQVGVRTILKPKGAAHNTRKKVAIAIPASVVSDVPHLREKTSKVGLIGRAASIFRVDEIIVFSDNPKASQAREMNLITLLLSYMDTPQYLRKRLFKLEPQLRYAGILPPLRTAHHPLNRTVKQLKIGEFREGITLSTEKENTLADIGVEEPVVIVGNQLPSGRRVTLRVSRKTERLEVEPVSRDSVPAYWGYSVIEEECLGQALKSKSFDLKIATSRRGVWFSNIAERMSAEWKRAKAVLLAFGAPSQGLYEIAYNEGLDLESVVDFVVNTIPSQGTQTVRTEEAIIASLAVLNLLSHS
jgi:predicted SPOUT superfamily RNA methylase MTH1